MEASKQIQLRLKGKSYQELETEMAELPTALLLELLNGKSRKIGSTAFTLINRRNAQDELAKAILEGKYTTRDGKVRAANTFCFAKVDSKSADEALLYLTRDKHEESADNALFALVALRRDRVITRPSQNQRSTTHISQDQR